MIESKFKNISFFLFPIFTFFYLNSMCLDIAVVARDETKYEPIRGETVPDTE